LRGAESAGKEGGGKGGVGRDGVELEKGGGQQQSTQRRQANAVAGNISQGGETVTQTSMSHSTPMPIDATQTPSCWPLTLSPQSQAERRRYAVSMHVEQFYIAIFSILVVALFFIVLLVLKRRPKDRPKDRHRAGLPRICPILIQLLPNDESIVNNKFLNNKCD